MMPMHPPPQSGMMYPSDMRPAPLGKRSPPPPARGRHELSQERAYDSCGSGYEGYHGRSMRRSSRESSRSEFSDFQMRRSVTSASEMSDNETGSPGKARR